MRAVPKSWLALLVPMLACGRGTVSSVPGNAELTGQPVAQAAPVPVERSGKAAEIVALAEQLPADVARRVATTSWTDARALGTKWTGPTAAGVKVAGWKMQSSPRHGDAEESGHWGFFQTVDSRPAGARVGIEGFRLCDAGGAIPEYNQGIARVMEAFAPFVVGADGGFAALDDAAAYRAGVLQELDAAAAVVGKFGHNLRGFAANYFVEPTLQNRSRHWWEALHALWRAVDAGGATKEVPGAMLIPGKRSATTEVKWRVSLAGAVPCELQDENSRPCVLLVANAYSEAPLDLQLADDMNRSAATLRLVADPDTLRPYDLVETVVEDSAILHTHWLRIFRFKDATPSTFDPCAGG